MTEMIARHWIDGSWIEGGKSGDSVDPATGETIGQYWEADAATARSAINTAKAAFHRRGWADDRVLRARVLNAMADRFEARGEELVHLLGRENGKVHAHGRFATGIVPRRCVSTPPWR